MNQFEARRVQIDAGAMSAGNLHAPAANTAAVVTLPAVEGECHVVDGLAWSYAGTGTLSGGNLKVELAGTTVFSMDVSAKGQDTVPFRQRGGPGEAVVVTLAAGGADVSGKVSLLGHGRTWAGPLPGMVGELDFSDYANSGLLVALA